MADDKLLQGGLVSALSSRDKYFVRSFIRVIEKRTVHWRACLYYRINLDGAKESALG